MKNKDILTLGYFILFFVTAVSCSTSKPEKTSQPNAQVKSEWNYQKIRETRQAVAEQEAQLPPPSPEDHITLDCVVLSAVQRQQSRASGCKALSLQAGYGENMFCCERPKD